MADSTSSDDILDSMPVAPPVPPPGGATVSGSGDGDILDAMTAAPPVASAAPKPPRYVPRSAVPHSAPAPSGSARAGVPHAPAAPPPELSLGQALHGAMQSAGPTFLPTLKAQIAPFLPQNWASDADTAVQLAKGAASKLGFTNEGNPTQAA